MTAFRFLACLAWFACCGPLQAAGLTIEITQGARSAPPIAVVPFGWEGARAPPQDIAAIIHADLERSGRLKPSPTSELPSHPHTSQEVNYPVWRKLGMDHLVVGGVSAEGGGYRVSFQLLDTLRGGQIIGYQFNAPENNLRLSAHRIADAILDKLTGTRGAFATRIAYITSERTGHGQRVALRVADSDGFNPHTIVSSPDPLLSPAWSPDGRRIAYVSFENRQAAVYVQDIFGGRRERVSASPGINSAPAWSPDGEQLALTLSKDGSPNVYVMNLASRSLRKLTDGLAISTEAAWSPDGRFILFTSDRGGHPQVYRVPAGGGTPERLTFTNNYNARASFSPDGHTIAMMTRVGGAFRIGVMDLQTKQLKVLSSGSQDQSPSFAPNGAMLIHAANGSVLETVSTDGAVHQRLAVDGSDVREPAWSPYSD
ncbi:MAG: Tol-Pal system beta propeller repeat protein TolB [Pseudomonadota bacterium]